MWFLKVERIINPLFEGGGLKVTLFKGPAIVIPNSRIVGVFIIYVFNNFQNILAIRQVLCYLLAATGKYINTEPL